MFPALDPLGTGTDTLMPAGDSGGVCDPVGGRIAAEVLTGLSRADPAS